MAEKPKDCLQCRLTSGGGVLAAGAYVVHHGKKLKGSSSTFVTVIGYALGAIGLLRIFDLPPFDHHSENNEEPTAEKSEDNGYIIGKFPSKFN